MNLLDNFTAKQLTIFQFLKKFPKKYLVIIAIALLIVSWFFFFKSNNKQTIEYVAVQRQDLKTEVSTSGILTGKNSINLHFKTSGKLNFVNVALGDSVSAGEILAGFDTKELGITLQQASNTYRDKQATVDKILDDIHLFQYGNGGFGNVGSGNETMTQRQLRTTAEVARDNAFDSLKLAQKAFEDALLISPITGTVTEVNLLPGQNISAAENVLRIVDLTEIFFDSEVDESDISSINIGQRAEITLNTYGDRKFTGFVAEITPKTKTTTNGATVVIVRILLDDSSIQKIDGLNGQVNIITSSKPNVLTLPQEAVKSDNTVLVKTDSGFKSKSVKLGDKSDTDIEIISGLDENEQIVKNPASIQTQNKSLFSNPLRFLRR